MTRKMNRNAVAEIDPIKEAAEPNADLKKIISCQIDGVDKAIDTAVYALYGLTEDEIKTSYIPQAGRC
jgi:type II restriction/modification system DNA methylase subunit YeeA